MARLNRDELWFPEYEVIEYTETSQSRGEPFEQYFGKMSLTEPQKEQRIKASRDFEDDLLFLFTLASLQIRRNSVNEERMVSAFSERYRASAAKYLHDPVFLDWYAQAYAEQTVRTTLSHRDNPWYMSSDRAIFGAENEANTILNRDDFLLAILNGFTKKQWVDMHDKRERKSHIAVGGSVIPITEPFVVGDGLMMYPKDMTYMPPPEEYVNCRCSIRYLR